MIFLDTSYFDGGVYIGDVLEDIQSDITISGGLGLVEFKSPILMMSSLHVMPGTSLLIQQPREQQFECGLYVGGDLTAHGDIMVAGGQGMYVGGNLIAGSVEVGSSLFVDGSKGMLISHGDAPGSNYLFAGSDIKASNGSIKVDGPLHGSSLIAEYGIQSCGSMVAADEIYAGRVINCKDASIVIASGKRTSRGYIKANRVEGDMIAATGGLNCNWVEAAREIFTPQISIPPDTLESGPRIQSRAPYHGKIVHLEL